MNGQKAQKMAEIVRCGKDAKYFINSYIKIQHPLRGRIPFKTYDFQNDVIVSMQNNRFNIVLKSRQLGLSTISAAFAVWYAMFYRDKNILVIATKLSTATNFIKKVKVALQSLPEWLAISKYELTQTLIRFDNGSQIQAIPTAPDAGRSEAISLLIVDECAHIAKFDDLWTGLYPTISTGGSAMLISTPNGVGGMYHKLWSDAEAGANDFNCIKLHWTVHPEHDQKWFDTETRNMTRRQIAQEMECDFVASGETFLQLDDQVWLDSIAMQPIERANVDRGVWIWKHVQQGHKYVMPADIARGESADYSTFQIIDIDTREVVAEYMGRSPPEVMGQLMMEWGKKYNNALAIPEQNSFGYATCIYLRDNGYPSLYYEKTKDNLFGSSHLVTPKDVPGFSTQARSRSHMLTKLEEQVRNKEILSYSSRLVNQFRTFVWINQKPQAMRGNNDDLIISLAIGVFVMGNVVSQNTTGMSDTIALLNANSMSRRSADEMPGKINEVQPPQNHTIMLSTPHNVHRPRAGAGGPADFSWLLK
jgi:hypothetical protein